MVTHIVLFKLRDRNLASQAKEVLLSMKGKIPQLLELEVGVDVLHSERSYDLGLISKVNSLEDLEAYQVHPAHLEIVKYITSIRESSVSLDFFAD